MIQTATEAFVIWRRTHGGSDRCFTGLALHKHSKLPEPLSRPILSHSPKLFCECAAAPSLDQKPTMAIGGNFSVSRVTGSETAQKAIRAQSAHLLADLSLRDDFDACVREAHAFQLSCKPPQLAL